MKVAGAIIAGGPARRLGGVAKPFLTVGGRTIAERQVAMLREIFARVLVVANDPAPWAPLAVEVVPDRRAVDWIEGRELAALDPEGRSFFNINTPDDLRRADAMAVKSGPRP